MRRVFVEVAERKKGVHAVAVHGFYCSAQRGGRGFQEERSQQRPSRQQELRQRAMCTQHGPQLTFKRAVKVLCIGAGDGQPDALACTWHGMAQG